jgi:hypothetical protein
MITSLSYFLISKVNQCSKLTKFFILLMATFQDLFLIGVFSALINLGR